MDARYQQYWCILDLVSDLLLLLLQGSHLPHPNALRALLSSRSRRHHPGSVSSEKPETISPQLINLAKAALRYRCDNSGLSQQQFLASLL